MTTQRWTDEMLDKLAEAVAKNTENAEKLEVNVGKLEEAVNELRQESKELNIRFSAYQQASQWVVNLAFGLLATATITTIVSAVFRR